MSVVIICKDQHETRSPAPIISSHGSFGYHIISEVFAVISVGHRRRLAAIFGFCDPRLSASVATSAGGGHASECCPSENKMTTQFMLMSSRTLGKHGIGRLRGPAFG